MRSRRFHQFRHPFHCLLEREVARVEVVGVLRPREEGHRPPGIGVVAAAESGLDGAHVAVSLVRRAAAVRSGPGRERVGSIVPGRGSDAAQVHEWLRVAAPVDGFIGFAVGRTNFRAPLGAYLNGQLGEADAIAQIAANYRSCVDTWLNANPSALPLPG